MIKSLKIVSYLFVFTILLQACNTNANKEKELFDLVIGVHDEVMPKMGKLRSLSTKLSQQADSLALDSLSGQEEKIAELRQLSDNLKKANESMMEWMRQFEPSEEGTPHGEVMNFLQEQKKQIDMVKEDMLNSEKEANKYFLDQ